MKELKKGDRIKINQPIEAQEMDAWTRDPVPPIILHKGEVFESTRDQSWLSRSFYVICNKRNKYYMLPREAVVKPKDL